MRGLEISFSIENPAALRRGLARFVRNLFLNLLKQGHAVRGFLSEEPFKLPYSRTM